MPLSEWILATVNLCKLRECTTSGMDHDVNDRLGVILICQCRFTDCNKCVTLAGDVGSSGGCACVETLVIWELSILSTQFFYVNLKLLKK